MDQVSPAPPIGHNIGNPIETLQAELKQDNARLIERRDELIESFERMPATCESEEAAQQMGDFSKQIHAAQKEAEKKRVGDKEPHLEAGRAVDGFFKSITDPLANCRLKVNKRLRNFLLLKEARERRKTEQEAERTRVEAAAAAAQAYADSDGKVVDQAMVAEKKARDAALAVGQKAAEFARTRGHAGSVSTLRTRWVFEVQNIKDVPEQYLKINDVAVNQAIKSGLREIAGLKITEEKTAIVS
jgi:hypothetical protein